MVLLAAISGIQIICIIAGAALVAVILMGSLVGKNKNVHLGDNASAYSDAPVNITKRSDRYTHTTTQRIKKNKD